MADYHSVLVTERTFRVKDLEAFTREIGWYAHDGHDATDFDGLTYYVEADGSIWLGGYDARFPSCWDEDTDEEINLTEIIQRHMADGEVAILHEVGYEKLRSVTGAVTVIRPTTVLGQHLGDLEQEMLQALERPDPAS